MNVVFYSNCQQSGLSYFLKKSINCYCNHIENYSLIKEKQNIPIHLLKNADIFIYQPIDKKHGIYSTDTSIENNILSYLPEYCKKISFPYIYNSALWILIPPADIDGLAGNYKGQGEYINKEPIIKLINQGYNLKTIIDKYKKGEIDFEYEARFIDSINILREKEMNCNIKVADFIEHNIRKKKLFFTQNHPTTCVFIHCVNQLLNILGINIQYNSDDYTENLVKLPGIHMHTTYDLQYWKFEYHVETCNDTYIPHIENIYKLYSKYYLYPLSYSIPEKCIQNTINKKRIFSKLIPGRGSTYIYKNEEDYNKNYQESYFGFTNKKGGFDCFRHYEILANNCIPFFIDIDNIHENTMTSFPKQIVKQAMNHFINNPTDLNNLNNYIIQLNEYTRNNLTCEVCASNIINIINDINNNNINPKILMISNNILNYSMSCLAYGLRNILNEKFIDFPKMSWLYSGQLFNLHIKDNIEIDRENIEQKILDHYYDYIIIGSIGPDEMDFSEVIKFVSLFYKKTELIFIFGGDRPFSTVNGDTHSNFLKTYLDIGICFVRELNNSTESFSNYTWNEYVGLCSTQWSKIANIAEHIVEKYDYEL